MFDTHAIILPETYENVSFLTFQLAAEVSSNF